MPNSQPYRGGGDADLAAVGSLIADRSRCRILLALADGRCLPASMLATEAGVRASTASSHLGKLVDAGLLITQTRGRYRYYTLAGPHVGHLIETLAGLAPAQPVQSLREGTRAHALRRARTCYDHLAGRLGVQVTEALTARGWLDGLDATRQPTPARSSGTADAVTATVTRQGRRQLTALGVVLPDSDAVRCCVDWTEQRPHLAGPHGRALLDRLFDLDWLRRASTHRAVLVTDTGRRGLHDLLELDAPA